MKILNGGLLWCLSLFCLASHLKAQDYWEQGCLQRVPDRKLGAMQCGQREFQPFQDIKKGQD